MRFLTARVAFAGLVFALSASAAFAQDTSVPFDMSGERGPTVEKTPAVEGDKRVTGETKQPEKKVDMPDAGLRRYIIPAKSLLLEGEVASHSFPLFLTPQQAGSATTINLGYS